MLWAGMSTCDVYFLNFCLILKTKKIKLGSLVKLLLSNKSLQSLQPILLSGPELEATEEKEGTAVGWGEVG